MKTRIEEVRKPHAIVNSDDVRTSGRSFGEMILGHPVGALGLTLLYAWISQIHPSFVRFKCSQAAYWQGVKRRLNSTHLKIVWKAVLESSLTLGKIWERSRSRDSQQYATVSYAPLPINSRSFPAPFVAPTGHLAGHPGWGDVVFTHHLQLVVAAPLIYLT